MPILSSVNAVTAKVYGLLSATIVKIQDSFNRTNNAASLGTADTGAVWTNTRGTWGISSNAASTSDAGSTYPLASVSVGKTNNTVSASITNGGPGVAFWVTDANSWWASSVDYNSTSSTTTTSSPGCCGGQGAPVNGSCPCGTLQTIPPTTYYYTSTTTTNTTYSCPSGGVLQGSGCYEYQEYCMCYIYVYDATPSTTTSTTCTSNYTASPNGSGCGSFPSGGGSYCTSSPGTCTSTITTYTYYTTIKLYSSVSGTVAVQSSLQIASSNSSYQVADSIQAQTNNNDITVKAYLGGPQLGGTLSYTASSPTKGPRVGIVRTPATANAGSVVDNFLSISD